MGKSFAIEPLPQARQAILDAGGVNSVRAAVARAPGAPVQVIECGPRGLPGARAVFARRCRHTRLRPGGELRIVAMRMALRVWSQTATQESIFDGIGHRPVGWQSPWRPDGF